MGQADFMKSLNNSKSYRDTLDAYTNMLSINIKMACHTLDKVAVIEKEFENNECAIVVLKVHFGKNTYYNCGVVIHKENSTLTDSCIDIISDTIKYKLHTTFIVNGKSFIIYDNINKYTIKECNFKTPVFQVLSENIAQNLDNLFEEERELRQLENDTNRDKVGYELNKIYNVDCMEGMKKMGDASVDFILTDIPYDGVNQFGIEKRIDSVAMRHIDRGDADILTFNLTEFLNEVTRITSNSCCIFCGHGQISQIYDHLINNGFTARLIIWEKTNPSPMAGEFIYLSGIEVAVWGKRKGKNGVFNAFCKNTVFRHPSGTRDIHPTQKNVQLFEELITDNTNEGDIVFDPCVGSGTTAESCLNTNRNFIAFELSEEHYDNATKRIDKIIMPGEY